MRSLRFLSGLAVFAMLLAACGDAKLSTSSADTGDDPTDGRGPRDDGPDDPVETPPDDPEPGERCCVLIPDSGGARIVQVGGTISMGVFIFELDSGDAAPDKMIHFEIVEAESVEASISPSNVLSDTAGHAELRLTAGMDPGTVKIRARSEGASAITLEVSVRELPTGDLRVRTEHTGADIYPVSPIEIQLFDSELLRCRDILPGDIPRDWLDSREISSTEAVADFDGLLIEPEYTVLAFGFGDYGERAAQGCIDGVRLRDGRRTEVDVLLQLLPLDPVGEYDVRSHWDFREAIADSGPVGEMLVTILDIFDDPGRGIVGFILDLVEDYVGGIISGTISLFLDLTGLDDVISDAINGLIESSPFLSDIVTIGRDIRAIIAELEVISTLQIGKLGSDYQVFGVDQWIGLALYWRLGCERDETSPDFDPDCGRIPIIIDSLDLGLLRGEWEGRVLGYNRLDIGRHPVDFEYGRLILHVIEYIVLPAIVGEPAPVTLEDLMSAIIGCAAIGDFVAGGDGSSRCALGACVSDTDVEGFCDSFISLTFGSIFRGFVEGLSFDAVLDMRGQCDLINNNEDLLVDALENGEYIGSIEIDGTSTPFVADFSGVRAE